MWFVLSGGTFSSPRTPLAWSGNCFHTTCMSDLTKNPTPLKNEENLSWVTWISYLARTVYLPSTRQPLWKWKLLMDDLNFRFGTRGEINVVRPSGTPVLECLASFMLVLKPVIRSPCHQGKLFLIFQSVLLCSFGTITEVIWLDWKHSKILSAIWKVRTTLTVTMA